MKFKMLLLGALAWASFAFGASDYEWVRDYEKGGAVAIEKRIEQLTQTREFWAEHLSSHDTRFGYFENLQYLFVATKTAPTLKLYERDGVRWNERVSAKSLVAKGDGAKLKEGDLTTPIGVYSLNGRLTRLDQYYGPLAFSTNYPNLYDRLQKRTGSGIWIHGLPLNGNREELNTRGCIAIENPILTQIDGIIDYRRTLLVTHEKEGYKEVSKDDLSTLLADLHAWKAAWKYNDIEKYLSFYASDFTRFDGGKFDTFAQNKRRIFAKGEQKEINFSDFNVVFYPNEQGRNLFRISFYENYKSKNYAFSGTKEIYAELKGGKMLIIMEQ